jgi:hypothetical protein
MGLYFDSGLLLFDSNNVAMHADCCCGEACACCVGDFNGFEVVVTGLADDVGDSECAENDCADLNDTYCIPASSGNGCTSGTLDGPDWCGGEAEWGYSITDNGVTCTLTVTLDHSITDDNITGTLVFTDGDNCSSISGDMSMTDNSGFFPLCNYSSALFHVNGLCSP